jgi:putative phosphoesterase
MNQRRAIRIGIIADAHGLFDPAIRRHFRGADHILHAGDIGDRSVIEQLEQIAPVTAVSGNVDDDQCGFPCEATIELAGHRIAIRHILYEGGKLTKEGQAFLDRDRPDICVFGHTHQPKIEWFCKTLLFKPDSVGPQWFNLLRAGRTLEVIDGKIKPMRIQQFENVVDNRILGLGEEIRFGERGFRNAGTGILAANPFVM